MISTSFKKQLIVNIYNTQLLPITKDKVNRGSIEANKRIKNCLLFKIDDDKMLNYQYKYKYETIDIEFDIHWLLKFLINPIYLPTIFYLNHKKYNIQKNMLHNINTILEQKQEIENRLDYAKYLEDIYD